LRGLFRQTSAVSSRTHKQRPSPLFSTLWKEDLLLHAKTVGVLEQLGNCQVSEFSGVQRSTKIVLLPADNNRKPLCRLHFNTSQKYLGVFDSEKTKTASL